MNLDPYQPPATTGDSSPYSSSPATLRHSGPGIASIFFWGFGVIGLCGALTIVGAFAAGDGVEPGASTEMTVGMGMLVALQTVIVGAVLALTGLLIAERRRLYAIIGLVLNLGTLLLFGALFVVGSLMVAVDG